jgi:hypothetical protein
MEIVQHKDSSNFSPVGRKYKKFYFDLEFR